MGGTQSQDTVARHDQPRISIAYSRPSPTNVGGGLVLLVTVQNDTKDQLPEQRLQLLGDSYWQSTCSVAIPPIDAHSECQPVTFELRCRDVTDPALVPASFTLRLEESKIDKKCKASFRTFTKRLSDYSPVNLPGANGAERFQLLVLGLAGSGKSSFLNSVMTLMHEGNDVASIAPSGGAFCHNTTSIRRYSVDSGNFDLCDTWGLNSNNYRDEHKILPALLEGWLPNGWTMHDHIRVQFNRVMANSTSQHQRKVHGVLFFMTAGAVHDEEEMDIAARSFRKVKELGYTPIVVLSQADRECEECRSDSLQEYPKLTALKDKAAQRLGIARRDIMHCVNYMDETTRSFQIDRMTYKILDMVLHNARDFCSISQPLQSRQSLFDYWAPEDFELEA